MMLGCILIDIFKSGFLSMWSLPPPDPIFRHPGNWRIVRRNDWALPERVIDNKTPPQGVPEAVF
jgi:hypothetical protein